MAPGVFSAKKKDGTAYYRANITYRGKHISLGSYPTEREAGLAYENAREILDGKCGIDELTSDASTESDESRASAAPIAFARCVSLINFRDNNIYIPTPIYLRKNYFSYYISPDRELKFDIDDLFYYSSHRILARQGHLYVNDYGMQVTLQGRYGVRPHAVCGRDYIFLNGDECDFRYSNIKVVNGYFGVARIEKDGQLRYRVKIHINGNFTVGTYRTEERAAIAYNKAVDLAKKAGIIKNFPENYIEELSAREYADIYTAVKISKKYMNYLSTF